MDNLFSNDVFLPEEESQTSQTNLPPYSVFELSKSLKHTVETEYSHIRIKGEVSGYRGQHASGHVYFALKDDKARIDAIIWRGVFAKLTFLPEEGMEIVATGKVTTFEKSSKYQIIIDNLQPAGAGALMALLEERRKKFQKEGLFEQERKKALPFLPQCIGVITSPTGAVIRDILHRLRDRFPVHVVLWPVRVQGRSCASEVCAAIEGFNALEPRSFIRKPDVIIIARGGGSLEDLWEFNDEKIIRSVVASKIPIISAIGHETDNSLLDYVADLRAPTPTAAAEKAVPVKADLERSLKTLNQRRLVALERFLITRKQSIENFSHRFLGVDNLWKNKREKLYHLKQKYLLLTEKLFLKKKNDFAYIKRGLALTGLEKIIVLRKIDFQKNQQRFYIALREVFRKKQSLWQGLCYRLRTDLIKYHIMTNRQHLKNLEKTKEQRWCYYYSKMLNNFTHTARLLAGLSYHNVLQRGFALVVNKEKKPIKKKSEIPQQESFFISFIDGQEEVKTIKSLYKDN